VLENSWRPILHPENGRRSPNLRRQPHRISGRPPRHRLVLAPLALPPTGTISPTASVPTSWKKLAPSIPILRFPGGNYLEGSASKITTTGRRPSASRRRPHPSTPWMYRSSDGMGLLEFLTWCEDLHMEPCSRFLRLRAQSRHINAGKDLEPFVQDALEELSTSPAQPTRAGELRRARFGHPAPSAHYIESATGVHDPSAPTTPASPSSTTPLKKLTHSYKSSPPPRHLRPPRHHRRQRPRREPHFYRTAEQFFLDVHRYDSYDRSGPKILSRMGYAQGTPTTNLGAALADAAWMTGLERNSDLVVMASYAPLFVNLSPFAMQWEATSSASTRSPATDRPAIYAQVMFSNHLGDQILAPPSTPPTPASSNPSPPTQRPDASTSSSSTPRAIPQPSTSKIAGAPRIRPAMTITTLTGKTTKDTNSITDPPTSSPPSRTRIPRQPASATSSRHIPFRFLTSIGRPKSVHRGPPVTPSVRPRGVHFPNGNSECRSLNTKDTHADAARASSPRSRLVVLLTRRQRHPALLHIARVSPRPAPRPASPQS